MYHCHTPLSVPPNACKTRTESNVPKRKQAKHGQNDKSTSFCPYASDPPPLWAAQVQWPTRPLETSGNLMRRSCGLKGASESRQAWLPAVLPALLLPTKRALRDISMPRGKIDSPLSRCNFSGNAEGSRNPWVMKFNGRRGCWFISLCHWTENYYITSCYFSKLIISDVM